MKDFSGRATRSRRAWLTPSSAIATTSTRRPSTSRTTTPTTWSTRSCHIRRESNGRESATSRSTPACKTCSTATTRSPSASRRRRSISSRACSSISEGEPRERNRVKSLRAKSLMIMGTASDVGKSVVVAALGRAFARAGVRVAPFKSQNMSNNSAVCAGGGEIGRAQAMQAEACGLAPTLDMNPVLLKPETDTGCQVVIGGRARFQMSPRDYDRYRHEAWPEIVASYERMAAEFELVLIEGSGGAAAVTLKDRDIVNWKVAELAGAPVVLVADIDKGGVFASLVGTVELIQPSERDRVRGMLINKFRGDVRLLDSGLRFLEERTGIQVLGV